MNQLMIKTLGYVPCDPEPGAGGGGGDPAPADNGQEPEPKNLLDGDDNGGSEPEKKDTAPAAQGPKNLLDDEPEPGKDTAPAAAQPPTDEQIAEWTKGIKATDLGDGVKWDDAALKAMTPALMEISGGDPKKAEGLVKAYTAHQQALAKAFAERQDAFNNGLIRQCEERFGADLKKVAGFARRGGQAIFGDKIWNEMKKVPSFANNPDILEKLAEFGRKVSTDSGKVLPKDGEAETDRGDVFHRMYGGVKV